MNSTHRITVDSPSLEQAPLFSALGDRGKRALDYLRSSAAGPRINRYLGFIKPTDHLCFKPLPEKGPLTDSDVLTVVSANLWHDWPRHRQMEERLDSFARFVERERVDMLLLQEVSRTEDLWVDEWLADRLGMAYSYVRANGDLESSGFEEGLAVFSRSKLRDPQILQLNGKEWPLVRRMALKVTAKTDSGDLDLYSVHLSHGRKTGATQLDRLREWVDSFSENSFSLIGGDFNAPEKTDRVGETRAHWVDIYRVDNPAADGATYQLSWPWGNPLVRLRLDYLFLDAGHGSWKVHEARHIQTHDPHFSDHLAVLARLSLQRP